MMLSLLSLHFKRESLHSLPVLKIIKRTEERVEGSDADSFFTFYIGLNDYWKKKNQNCNMAYYNIQIKGRCSIWI